MYCFLLILGKRGRQKKRVINLLNIILTLKYQSLKINLPTLGYNMMAERTKPLEEFIFQETKAQENFLNFFPKKFNSLFFN